METRQAIMERRSIRKYKKIPISEEDIRDILEAGIMAPSASNYQPWYFVAVSNPEKLKSISETMTKAAEILLPSLKQSFPNHPKVVAETRQFISLLGNAPLCIMAFLYKEDETYLRKETEFMQSTAAAIENMLLTAWDKGIGSCWLTSPLESGMDKVFREEYAPDHGKMVALLTLGYPDQSPRMPRRKPDRYTVIS